MLKDIELMFGNSEDLLLNIPDKFVNLIIIDPPYFRIKKHYWDNQWNSLDLFLKWFERIISELYRISKDSSSIYCFSYPKFSFEIESIIRKYYIVLNQIVWEKYNDKGFDGWKQKTSKESLRKYYPNTERIIFAEKKSFGKILKNERIKNEFSTIQLAEIIGSYGVVNHGGSVSNWENDLNIPTDDQYLKLCGVLNLPNKNEVIRTFNCSSDIQYTDVLHFKTVKPYKGKHPCEKPQELLEHLISMSSNKTDVVLDCFMGTGSTGISAKKLERKFIGIEKDREYYNIAKEKIENYQIKE